MSDEAVSMMKAIQKSINLYISMSQPNEDNEIKEQPISAMASVLLYNQDDKFLYDVEVSYRDILQKYNPDGYNREGDAANAAFGHQNSSIAISEKESNANRNLRYLVKFRVVDERRPFGHFQDDFARLEHLSGFLGDRSWTAVVCAMICETSNREIDQRKSDFKERTGHYAQINAPSATGLRYFWLEPTWSTSRNWKWVIGACVVDFRRTEH